MSEDLTEYLVSILKEYGRVTDETYGHMLSFKANPGEILSERTVFISRKKIPGSKVKTAENRYLEMWEVLKNDEKLSKYELSILPYPTNPPYPITNTDDMILEKTPTIKVNVRVIDNPQAVKKSERKNRNYRKSITFGSETVILH